MQQADITRIQALATADSQQILACGGVADTTVNGRPGSSDRHPQPAATVARNAAARLRYLQFTYIQALQQLAASGSNSTLVLPFDKNLTPLLQVRAAAPARAPGRPRS